MQTQAEIEVEANLSVAALSGQAVHAPSSFFALKVPIGQAVQLAAPASAEKPGLHCKQLLQLDSVTCTRYLVCPLFEA
jgi:hypothetical protein